MSELLREYCKKLKLGPEILEEYLNIPLDNKEEFLTKILKISVDSQEVRKINRLIKNAKFDVIKTFEGYCFEEVQLPESLLVEDIKAGNFIEKHQNLIFYGSVGTGKTYLATAIGVEACNRGKKVRFFKVANLINELIDAHNQATLGRYLNNLKKYDLIILDELGYIPIGEKGAELLFQVIADCYERKSLIVTTNIEFSKWNGIFMDKKITTAILDRIIHYEGVKLFL